MYAILKRLTDFLIALLALILLLPILVPVVILLLLTGEHEVFYFQKRIGYRNRPFYIWKFATMVKNSPNIGTGEITLRNDPRVTSFGRFLRKTKINELPQIINVLKGDMSIVGPRPLMEVSFNLYSPKCGRRSTSPNQASRVSDHSFSGMRKKYFRSQRPREMYAAIYPYKAELEMWYLQNRSIKTDYSIIFLTAWSIVFPQPHP